MAHAVSDSYFRSDHMSPQAMALAALLHALAAFALWWMSTHQRPEMPAPEAIEVTIEQQKPPEPPPPKQQTPQPTPPTPPVRLGMAPPADIISNKPTQVPSTLGDWQKALPPQPQASEEPAPAKPWEPLPPSTAKPFERPKAAPPPPPAAAPAKPAPAPPQPQAKPTPPPPQPRPSPLASQPHRPSPDSQAAAPSPLVNPADVVNRGRAQDVYLWQVVRKVMNYHYQATANVEQGTTVARITIARDGRLLEASIAISSGYPALDKGVIDGQRAGSPYAPLPPEIPGDRATFNLPLVSRHRQ